MTLITLQLNDNEENLQLARTIVLCFTLSRYSWAKIQSHQHKPGDVIIHKIVDDVPDIYRIQSILTDTISQVYFVAHKLADMEYSHHFHVGHRTT